MGSRYGVCLEVFADELPGSPASVCVWIQDVVDGRENLPPLERGPLVRPIRHGLREGSNVLALWTAYAERMAGGWNLLAAVADLVEMPKHTPWALLAEYAKKAGRPDIYLTLHLLFDAVEAPGIAAEQPLSLDGHLPRKIGGDGASLLV
jgi:hypothetical protein